MSDDVTPVFVSRKTAAKRFEISVETFDDWVRQGFVPRAHVQRGQIYRWHWPSLEAKLAGVTEIKQVEEGWKMPEGPYIRTRRRKGQSALEAAAERRKKGEDKPE